MSGCRHSVAERRLTVYAFILSLIWSLVEGSLNGGESLQQNISPGSSETPNSTIESPFDDLAKLFGIHRVPLHLRNRTPPEYFQHLFKSTSDEEGIARRPAPYHADTISGYMDGASGNQRYYFYNITSKEKTSNNFLNAEFHLYRMNRQTARRTKRSVSRYFILLKIYAVRSARRRNTPYGNRLIDIQRVVVNHQGWIVFNIRSAVEEWMTKNGTNNYGVYISAQNMDGSPAEVGEIRFAQRGQHHDRVQPIIVVYTKNHNNESRGRSDKSETPLTRAFDRSDPNRYTNLYHGLYYLPPSSSNSEQMSGPDSSRSNSRVRRSVGSEPNQSMRRNWDSSPSPGASNKNPEQRGRGNGRRRHSGNRRISNNAVPYCSRHTMEVDFVQMGWDQWIISPTRFNARVCSGPCPFPLGQAYHPTNHAVVQSIWHHLRPGNTRVRQPCCVPHSLNALNMLYYDEEQKVVLKSYDNMVVTSCGCK